MEMQAGTDTTGHRVVIVGGGFGGLRAARTLGRAVRRARRTGRDPAVASVHVTLVDRHNHHTFQPLLYQAATAALEPHNIGRSLRSILRGLPVTVRLAAVEGVDLEERALQLGDGTTLPYDTLVLAAGAKTADFGVDGVSEHAFPLKWISDASRLRDHMLSRFEHVDAHPSSAADGALTFVIAGAGPTGVELAGAIAELIDGVIRRDHPRLRHVPARIVLVEMLDDVLPPYGDRSRAATRRELERRGVEIRTGTAIERLDPGCATLSDGERISTQTVIWTAGVTASSLGERLDVELAKGGRVPVEDDLRLRGRGEVYVIGDLAAATGPDDDPLPQLAPVAVQQGQHVAEQLLRRRRGLESVAFRYRDRGTMATIGRRAAVAELPLGLSLSGTVGWVAWLGLHLVTLIGFRNRVAVLLNWAYSYLGSDRAARLILEARDSSTAAAATHEPRAPDEPSGD